MNLQSWFVDFISYVILVDMTERLASEMPTLEEIEHYVTNLEVAPAGVLLGKEYICLVLVGNLTEAVQKVSQTIFKQIRDLPQNWVAISMVNVDPLGSNGAAEETEWAGLVRLITTLGAKKK